MKETPIIMSGDHLAKVLDGTKTMTRRVIKPQPTEGAEAFAWFAPSEGEGYAPSGCWYEDENGLKFNCKCPYGQVGDRLWVRETHYRHGFWSIEPRVIGERQSYSFVPMNENMFPVRYMDNQPDVVYTLKEKYALGYFKRPSIFMPRWASRITLEITEARVERVQEIIEEDCVTEGLVYHEGFSQWYTSPDTLVFGHKTAFQILWDSLNAKRGYGWEVNPWCWCISFKLRKD